MNDVIQRNISRARRAGRLFKEFASSNFAYDFESEKKAYVEIEKMRRRYVFQLLHVLSFTDYEVGLGMGMDDINKYVDSREDFRISDARNYRTYLRRSVSKERSVFLSDSRSELLAPSGWKKRVHVDYDCFGGRDLGFSIPFGVDPPQVLAGRTRARALDRYRSKKSKVTLLFAGACQPEEYATDEIKDLFGKVPRNELYEELFRVLDEGNYTTTQDVERLLNADEKIDAALFVLFDRQDRRVSKEDWFRVLSAADFFVAGPGVYMPMSHNAVEALAVGTIPILEYPDLFTPNLSSAGGCVAFEGREAFSERVQSCLDMGMVAREELKRRATEYYDTHLSPMVVGKRLQHEVLDGPSTTSDGIERLTIIAGHESVDALKSNLAGIPET
jgi:hypothetical protein